ncbi:hypothetical protein pb186bvf_006600 [Paramecium bursaria]
MLLDFSKYILKERSALCLKNQILNYKFTFFNFFFLYFLSFYNFQSKNYQFIQKSLNYKKSRILAPNSQFNLDFGNNQLCLQPKQLLRKNPQGKYKKEAVEVLEVAKQQISVSRI